MALATQCPHCHTTFRVAHDQLKLRAGLVRCGACKQIFNGIENLLRPEQQPGTSAVAPSPTSTPASVPATAATPTAAPASERPPVGMQVTPPAPGPTTAPTAPASSVVDFYLPEEMEQEAAAETTDTRPPHMPQETAFEEGAPNDARDADAGAPSRSEEHDGANEDFTEASRQVRSATAPQNVEPEDDPLLRMTLMDVSEDGTAHDSEQGLIDPERPDPIDQAIADLERKPLRAAGEEDDYEEPEFVRQGRRRQRRSRAMRWVLGLGSAILLLAFAAQAAYVFRDQLAAHFPQTKPLLLEACAWLDCQVGLPAQIDVVAIETSELQTLAANSNTLGLTILLRNHASVAQAWPHLELTLNDSAEKPLVRRVFAPAEYLPNGVNARLGFPSQSEQAVRLYFEPEGIKASGYRVYLFYP